MQRESSEDTRVSTAVSTETYSNIELQFDVIVYLDPIESQSCDECFCAASFSIDNGATWNDVKIYDFESYPNEGGNPQWITAQKFPLPSTAANQAGFQISFSMGAYGTVGGECVFDNVYLYGTQAKPNTNDPTIDPTANPTKAPSKYPSSNPTENPTSNPTNHPSNDPTIDPTENPTKYPIPDPTNDPTNNPSSVPTINPTVNPTNNPVTLSETIFSDTFTTAPCSNWIGDPAQYVTCPYNEADIQCDCIGLRKEGDVTRASTAVSTETYSNIELQFDVIVYLDPNGWQSCDECFCAASYSTDNGLTWNEVKIYDFENYPNEAHDPQWIRTQRFPLPPTAANEPNFQISLSMGAYGAVESECVFDNVYLYGIKGNFTNDPTIDPTEDPTKIPTKYPASDPTEDPTSKNPTNYPSNDPTIDPTANPIATNDPSSYPTMDPTPKPIQYGHVTIIGNQHASNAPPECTKDTFRVSIGKQQIGTMCCNPQTGLLVRLPCQTGHNYQEAVNLCASKNLILCSRQQLFMGEGEEMCDHFKTRMLWTSTPCVGWNVYIPTIAPTQPTVNPTNNSTVEPTLDPTIDMYTTKIVTKNPTIDPTDDPTNDPTISPTNDPPTSDPTIDPTHPRTIEPSYFPTYHPSQDPIKSVAVDTTSIPSQKPSPKSAGSGIQSDNNGVSDTVIIVAMIIGFAVFLVIVFVSLYCYRSRKQNSVKASMIIDNDDQVELEKVNSVSVALTADTATEPQNVVSAADETTNTTTQPPGNNDNADTDGTDDNEAEGMYNEGKTTTGGNI